MPQLAMHAINVVEIHFGPCALLGEPWTGLASYSSLAMGIGAIRGTEEKEHSYLEAGARRRTELCSCWMEVALG